MKSCNRNQTTNPFYRTTKNNILQNGGVIRLGEMAAGEEGGGGGGGGGVGGGGGGGGGCGEGE